MSDHDHFVGGVVREASPFIGWARQNGQWFAVCGSETKKETERALRLVYRGSRCVVLPRGEQTPDDDFDF